MPQLGSISLLLLLAIAAIALTMTVPITQGQTLGGLLPRFPVQLSRRANAYSEAQPYLNKGPNTKPEFIPHVHALLGKTYAKTNRTQEAIVELKLGLADVKDSRLHCQLGRLYLKIGDRDSAKQALKCQNECAGKRT
jgi:predicted Zn-dependent protease